MAAWVPLASRMQSMSWWEAAVAAKSACGPVRILTVPEGMSLTAMASARETARVGKRSEAARMQGLPAARAEAMRETGAVSAGESGAKMAVTPEGDEGVDGGGGFGFGVAGGGTGGGDEFGGEERGATFEDFGESVEDLAAEVGGGGGPGRGGFAGGGDGVAEVFAGAVADVGDEGAGGAEGGEDATAFGAGEFAADEELAGLEDGEARWGFHAKGRWEVGSEK
jgi:hypothetical protein